MKHSIFGLLLGSATVLASFRCTRSTNPVDVNCGTNEKLDSATRQCVKANCGTNEKLDPATRQCIKVNTLGGPPGRLEVTPTPTPSTPSTPSTPTPEQPIVSDSPIPASSIFLRYAPRSNGGGFKLFLRTAAEDIKNLTVSYPENSASFSSTKGFVIKAYISWEQSGKKCRLEDSSFVVADISREQSVSAVCK